MVLVAMWHLGLVNGYMIVNKKVVLNGENSRLQDVLSGVPQGSVLGPTLLFIFVNDIDTVISSHIQKFADDCQVSESACMVLLLTDRQLICFYRDV